MTSGPTVIGLLSAARGIATILMPSLAAPLLISHSPQRGREINGRGSVRASPSRPRQYSHILWPWRIRRAPWRTEPWTGWFACWPVRRPYRREDHNRWPPAAAGDESG